MIIAKALRGWTTTAFLLSWATTPSARCETAYVVTVDSARPLEATVSLVMPAARNSRKLLVRGLQWGLKSQISDPRIGSIALKPGRPGEWLLPPGTRCVRWKVTFANPAPGLFDASEQSSVYFPKRGWWLFSEPTSLLRVAGDPQAASLTIRSSSGSLHQVGATPYLNGRWRVPPDKGAPEFYAFGNIALTKLPIGAFTVRYVADDPERVASLGLAAQHAAALGYLAKVVPPPSGTPDSRRSLMVVWLGIDRGHGRAGGAAGSRSFLANYVFSPDEKAPFNSALTTMITAHEQFHQLVELARGKGPSLPTWLSESLAHYYGLKALGKSGLAPAAIEDVRRRFIDTGRPVEDGLIALNRRHAKGDSSVYGRFYSQGATFWSEVDRVIVEHSLGRQSLDTLVPALLTEPCAADGQLPPGIMKRMRAVGGPEIDVLVERFVEERVK